MNSSSREKSVNKSRLRDNEISRQVFENNYYKCAQKCKKTVWTEWAGKKMQKKNQMEHTNMKNTKSEMKISLGQLNSRLNIREKNRLWN